MPAISTPPRPRVVGHLAHSLARPHHLRQHALGNAENAQQLCIPLALHDIEEQRPRGIVTSVTCRCPLVRCQINQLSTVPKANSPRSARAARPAHVQNPAHFCGGKIRVQNQPGFIRDCLPDPALLQLLAPRGRAAILPHNSPMIGLPVARSHTITVSRWLVMPMPPRHGPRAPPCQAPDCAGKLAGHKSPLDRVPPACLRKNCSNSCCATAAIVPASSKRIARELVSPGPVQGCKPLSVVYLRNLVNTPGGAGQEG